MSHNHKKRSIIIKPNDLFTSKGVDVNPWGKHCISLLYVLITGIYLFVLIDYSLILLRYAFDERSIYRQRKWDIWIVTLWQNDWPLIWLGLSIAFEDLIEKHMGNMLCNYKKESARINEIGKWVFDSVSGQWQK